MWINSNPENPVKKNYFKSGLPFYHPGINPLNRTKLKKIVWLGAVLFCLVACENVAKVDSKADSLYENPDKVAEDSAKQKGEQTLEAIKEKVQAMGHREDSLQPDTVRLADTAKLVNP